jgi:hypothetical protein
MQSCHLNHNVGLRGGIMVMLAADADYRSRILSNTLQTPSPFCLFVVGSGNARKDTTPEALRVDVKLDFFMMRLAFPRVGTSEKSRDARAGCHRYRIRARPTRVPPYWKKSQVRLE